MQSLLPFLFCFIFLVVSQTGFAQRVDSTSIIPQPAQLELKEGAFNLTPSSKILLRNSADSLRPLADYLNNQIASATWADLAIVKETTARDSAIVLTLNPEGHFKNDEAYHLSVTPQKIEIAAPTTAGVFYGIQSLLQLLPPEIFYDDPTRVPQNTVWNIPAVEITDYPRYEYRGLHLDVARHFFSVSFIKQYIDLLAMHKMNRFHWHLTEDQGWRIQIKQYPKLTEIGAWRDSTLVGHYGTDRYDGERYGGYYTQEEIREVVQYAKKRHVTIIPEIEIPGHSSAALAAYPELSCNPDKQYHVQTTWGIFEDIYCPSETTFTFLENVLTEVMKLFPSQYIHIGGDEAPKDAWKNSQLAQRVIEREGLENEEELQSYFITRIEKFLNKHGRQIIGWDEILEGGLAPNATVMSWRGEKGGIKAAKQGHNVVMTPGSPLYFDYYQADAETEPLAIGWLNTLKETYSYEPTPDELTKEESRYILGAQGNVWTEYMKSGNKVEYMAYPRASALSEVVWSPKEKRNWDGFLQRLQTHFQRLEFMGVNAAEHYRNEITNE
ncbi:MAG: beta-N-acetylhexosaminidase [Balneolaceae bacterium]|nr:beta-N-acetylhexosaminidase [Balneolaceae bacterium]